MRPVSRRSLLGGTTALAVAATQAACSSSSSTGAGEGVGSIYFLNVKPEAEEAFKEIAAFYTDNTGVKIKVATAAASSYEQTLKTEVAKPDAPTLFTLNGPMGYANWSDYASDLTDMAFTKALADETMTVRGEDDRVYGVPLGTEGYGIIYNKAVLDKYFATPGAKAASVEEITSFGALKQVAEDMQSKKAELGIEGAFASTSLAPGEDWRWQTHLANYPVFYEFRDAGVQDSEALKLTYGDQYKEIFDLYLTNSTVEPSAASARTVADSMAEFALGKAAFVQNGNWAWSQIAEVEGRTVKEEDIHFLPIYIGVKGEDKAGMAIGTENYLTINSQAPEEDQKATAEFLTWLFTDPEGAAMASEKLGIIAPYKAFAELAPADPLGKEVVDYMGRDDLYAVNWVFATFPSRDFRDQLGQRLAQYASGKEDWRAVTEYFTSQWAAEKA